SVTACAGESGASFQFAHPPKTVTVSAAKSGGQQMKAWIAAAALLFALAATPAHAQDAKQPPVPVIVANADTDADLRCLAVALILIGQTQDPAQQQALNSAAIYYLGRLDGRAPEMDLEERLFGLLHDFNAEQLAAERVRCGQLLVTR